MTDFEEIAEQILPGLGSKYWDFRPYPVGRGPGLLTLAVGPNGLDNGRASVVSFEAGDVAGTPLGFSHRPTLSDGDTREHPRAERAERLLVLRPMPRRPTIAYRQAFEFGLTPSEVWASIERVDQFERWWPWLQEFRMEGASLAVGSVLHGMVVPPLPYRMRIRVMLTGCEAPTAIDALIGGDLEGLAQLRMQPHDDGSLIEVAWTVEMMQRPMRLASRFGLPLLQWGHDRVVEMTVAGFRRRLEAPG